MGMERERKALELFETAVELAADDRGPFLESACGDDLELRRAVLSMLDLEARAQGFLEKPIAQVAALDPGPGPEPEIGALEAGAAWVGKKVGRYRIEGVIDHGGMGVVYRAVQEEPRRTVALKLMSQAVVSRRALRWIPREAEILAKLEHPGIARIYDAGVHDDGSGGVPYFVMEYVAGARDIIAHAAVRGLGTRQRLELFARACDAVQYAHQKGIIHRDLKPGNMLIDPSGQPKLIDFGIARATDSDVAITTLRTEPGEIMGTLRYMSPEQCAADSHDIDTRSDVYSLGVVLYELLTRMRPYEFDGTDILHAMQTIRQRAPIRPSSSDPSLGGDVETILLKALEKERERRYQSAAQLAGDIRCYLNSEPIAARPPSLTYRLAKLIRRRKWQAATVGAACLALVAGAVVLVVSLALVQAREARQRAQLLAYGKANGAAEAALRSDDVLGARRALEQADPGLRGWEWSHLRSRLDQSCLTLRPSQPHLTGVAFSPDGRWLAATSSSDQPTASTLCLWDAAELRRGRWREGSSHELAVGGRGLSCMAFSPDGRWLAAGTYVAASDPLGEPTDVRLAVWDSERGSLVLSEPLDGGLVKSLAFSPDGSLLAVGVDARPAKLALWRIWEWSRLGTVVAHGRWISALAFGPDGNILASGTDDNTVRLWGLEDSGRLHLLATLRGHENYVSSLAFSPDGRLLASGSMDNTVKIWDPAASIDQVLRKGNEATGVEVATLEHHTAWVEDVAFSPDGRYLASAGGDRVIRLWHVEDAWPIWERPLRRQQWLTRRIWYARTLCGHEQRVVNIGFSPAGDLLASASADGTVKLWPVGAGSGIPTLEGHLSSVESVAFSPSDPTVIASAAADGTVRLWDTVRCEEIDVLWQRRRASCVAFAPGKAWLAVATHDETGGEVAIWDTERREIIRTFPVGRGAAALAFSPDGAYLAWGDGDWDAGGHPQNMTVWIWKSDGLEDPKPLGRHGEKVNSLAFSQDGRQLASASDDRTVRIWDVATRTLLRELAGHEGGVRCVAFDPGGRFVASSSRDQTAIVWDARTGRVLQRLGEHAGVVDSLAFSPDGSRIVTGAEDSTLRVWEPQTGILLASMYDHAGRVTCVRWSPDGTRIASAATGHMGKDNTIKLWETDVPDDERWERAVALLGRERVAPHVEELFHKHFFGRFVAERIASDPWFDQQGSDAGELRAAAVRLARVRGEYFWLSLAGCWKAPRIAGQPKEVYEEALRVGTRLAKDDDAGGAVSSGCGMALYRLGRFEEALRYLEDGLKSNGDNATDLAFLTMCLQQLGRYDEANGYRARLTELVSDRGSELDDVEVALLREVDELIPESAVLGRLAPAPGK